MDFRILGPLEVLDDHGVVTLGGRKPRAVLAVLLLSANEPVSPERLARALWGDDAPAGAVKTVQVHVSRLRKALDHNDVLTTTPGGYCLEVQPGELDAQRFEQLVDEGRRALAAGRPEEASALLREAAGLWRGPPLADLAFEPFAQTEIDRLEEQRLAALEARVEADAAAGRHAELVPELWRLVAEHPTRERLAGQLMVALYRCGRQTEALDAYRSARGTLAGEIGVEPGPELRALQEAVLRHDPTLELRAAADLPHALESAATAPLAGRDDELRWLRARWQEARGGAGRLIVLAGPRGMGKTRLAAALAVEAHADGATVLYASGTGPAQACVDAAADAAGAPRPVLLVVDDTDRAGEAVLAVLRELSGSDVLVLATATHPEALEPLEPQGVLFLKQLGSAGIGAIAALYVSDEGAEGVPIEWLLGASGGVPARVHDVASQWARQESTRRVAAGRAELRSMEDELAGSVVQLQSAHDWYDAGAGEDGERVVCPFKGLASFEEADAPYFFGRERLVAELVARLVGAPLLGVVGPSGSGKSSVVRAGLLPALAGGVLPGSQEWPRVVLRPGEHPEQELRMALDGAGAGRFVLAVDQFEETFTVCRDEAERVRFIAELVRESRRKTGAVVIVALRADFYGRCAGYPEFARLLAANHVLVGAMRHVELRRTVVGPAERAGLHVEPDLVEALVNDVEEEPGALPLLSTALLELWQRRDGRHMRLGSYEDTGGVLGAVARLAEQGFGRLDEGQRALARTVLLRLAEVEVEGGVERRRLPVEELEGGREDVAAVIGLLTDARLLTVSAGAVEFAHEALLREWPRLRDWVEENREDLRVHRSLSAAATEWERLGRHDGDLYGGARLAEARAWADRGDPGPTGAEREFLAASLGREERERRSHRRHLLIAFASLALGLVVVGVVALVAIHQRREAVDQKNIATSRELALQSEKSRAADPDLAVRLALWALDTAPTGEADLALREATHAFHQIGVLPADSLDANAAAFSPDGARVVTGGTDGRALVWDAATHRVVDRLPPRHGAVLAARYSHDGNRIVLGFEDGTVLVTDSSLAAARTVLRRADTAEDVAFSRDGDRIVAGFGDGLVQVVAADGSGRAQTLAGEGDPVNGVDISPDGRRVVSAGQNGSVRLWDRARGGTARVLLAPSDLPENDVAFSPDGRRILGVGDDRLVRVWSARSGAEHLRLSGQGRQLIAAAWSADGRRFAAGGRDGVTRVWSDEGGDPVAELRGQRSRVLDVGFGATSDRVVSGGFDGTVRLWDAGRTRSWTVPGVPNDVEFNHDGTLIATSSGDGTVRVWDPATGRLENHLPGDVGYTAARFSPTSDTVVITNDGGANVRIWPVASDTAKVEVQRPGDTGMNSANYGPTDDRIVYVDLDSKVAVRDLASGDEVTLKGTPKMVWGAELTPDGKHVVVVPDRDVQIWRLDRPDRPEHVLKGHRGPVNEVDFTPDGRIATAGTDGTARVWGPDGRLIAVTPGQQDELSSVAFTAGGTQLITSSQDGGLRLFDARSGALLAVLESAGELYDSAVSPGGTIATLGTGDVLRVFPCDVCGSLEHVREVALSRSPRPLTARERRQFLAAAG